MLASLGNTPRSLAHPGARAGLAAALLLAAAGMAQAAPDRSEPDHQRDTRGHAPAVRWYDNVHGHAQHYPRTGVRLPALPAHTPLVAWSGAHYGFHSGVWYSPAGRGGYVVVRPPLGIVVRDLPTLRTLVVVGGISYWYLNGVHYREHATGGYEGVANPASSFGSASGAPGRLFVYPSQGQSAEVQATDEYECHRWAASQSGFDPVPVAAGQAANDASRADYVRAQTACLQGRGYSVR